ncbi:FeoB-associated Cys-rich membrane protein [Dubosiella muris]|uniref:FeoB-associated Cys-rich membrane protein n=1 Tax=Dubosiella muris TaxID=3038133 RepID=A0AC61R6P0_9FIRM|nr:FeoB-associated Cys-rich membrane protein [Dubosiella muris]TGY65692.1 FeoB-associated Cys-rich membrane protein [Dubosiella muris]
MNIADLGVILVIGGLVLWIVRFLRKNKNSCHGDCSSCASSCSKIDWDEVRKSIHEEKNKK